MPRVHVPDEHAFTPSQYVWSHYAPELGAAAGNLSATVFSHTRLSVREMEAARIRIAEVNGCLFCLSARVMRDLPERMERLGGDISGSNVARNTEEIDEEFYEAARWGKPNDTFSERERRILDYAGRFAERPKSMEEDEAFWEGMHANFTDAEIVDMTFCMVSWLGLGRMTHVLELDGVCVPA